jgi:hypothetical protein
MIFCSETTDAGKRRLCCEACGLQSSLTKSPPEKYWHQCKGPKAVASTSGPGTELKALLAELGITEFKGCGCCDKVRQMDAWGIDGCKEHFAEIRAWLIEAQAKASWFDKVKAAALAATSGLATHTDPLDIAGSLVRLAIQRAEEKQEGAARVTVAS